MPLFGPDPTLRQPRQRWIPTQAQSAVVDETGTADVGFGGTGNAVKVAVVSGVCSVGAVATGAAVKVAPQAGISAAGLSSTGQALRPGSHVRNVGTNSSATTGTTLTITVPAPGVPAGDMLFGRLVYNASGGAPTVSDTRGNTWTRDRSAAGSGSVTRLSIFSCPVTTALQAGDTITFTHTSVAERAAAVDQFFAMSSTPLDLTNGTTGSSTTPSVSGGPTTTQADEVWFGVVSTNGGTDDTYTEHTAASWTTLPRVGSAASGTAVTVNAARKTVSATGQPAYAPTLGTSRVWVDFVAAYKIGVTVPTAAQGGVCALGAAPTGNAVKVAPVTGSCAVGVATATASKKVAQLVGAAALGVAATGTARKTAPQAGTSSLALAATGKAAHGVSGVSSVGLRTSTIYPASRYDVEVLADDPVGFWSTATGTDASGFARHATRVNSPGSTTLPNGDAAPLLDGVNQYLDCGDNDAWSPSTTGRWTVEAWIRPDTLQFDDEEGTGYVHWMGKSVFGPTQSEWVGRMYSLVNSESRPNRISGYAFNSTGGVGVGSSFQDTVTAGQWIHYVLVINTADAGGSFPDGYTKIYKNSVQRDQDNLHTGTVAIVPSNTTAPMRIGTASLDSFFEGAVGKVAVYDYELTQARVQAHYLAMVSFAGTAAVGVTATATEKKVAVVGGVCSAGLSATGRAAHGVAGKNAAGVTATGRAGHGVAGVSAAAATGAGRVGHGVAGAAATGVVATGRFGHGIAGKACVGVAATGRAGHGVAGKSSAGVAATGRAAHGVAGVSATGVAASGRVAHGVAGTSLVGFSSTAASIRLVAGVASVGLATTGRAAHGVAGTSSVGVFATGAARKAVPETGTTPAGLTSTGQAAHGVSGTSLAGFTGAARLGHGAAGAAAVGLTFTGRLSHGVAGVSVAGLASSGIWPL